MVTAREAVEAKIKSTPVVVYGKTTCGFCRRTQMLLTQLGAKYDVVNLNQIPDGEAQQDALEEITGQGTVPNVFINGQSIGGNSQVQKMHKNGELVPLLAKYNALS